jgi:hypothetical protein
MWDDKDRMAYEIQTNAREDAILSNVKKREKYNIPITWVSYNEDILNEIKKTTSNEDAYMLLKI